MRKFKGADPAVVGSNNPRAKVAVLAIALFAVAAAFVYSLQQRRSAREEPMAEATPEVGPGQFELPSAPPGTFDEVRDATTDERLIQEELPLQLTRSLVRQFTPRLFEGVGVPGLDASVVERIQADPAAFRGEAFRMRGKIASIDARKATPGAKEELYGRLELSDGALVHFLALRFDDEFLVPGEWARLDGVFFKITAEKGPDDVDWIEAPLIVGARLYRSYPDIGAIDSIAESDWASVLDDDYDNRRGLPEEMRWKLLAWIGAGGAEALDWTSAPALDDATLQAIVDDGAAFRGKPFRVPVSVLQDTREWSGGENPARMERYTDGWIGNFNWKVEPVFYFQAPNELDFTWEDGERHEFAASDRIVARAVFFKNIVFETPDEALRTAPAFMLVDMQPYVRPKPKALTGILVGFIGLTVALCGLLVFLLRRDRRLESEMERRMIERRRARRSRTAETAGA